MWLHLKAGYMDAIFFMSPTNFSLHRGANHICLEVPAGPFDIAARYYLPKPEIMSGEWTMPLASLVSSG